jgi:hypothetical protein
MTLPMTGAGPSAVSAGGNGLLTALIAYWPGDEASGNLLDAHTNALHLTDVNTVTNNTGKVYATARQYTAANQEYHNRASEALLQIGDVDFTIASWVYCDALATGSIMYRGIVAKGSGNPAFDEYSLGQFYLDSACRFRLRVADASSNVGYAIADTLGTPSLSTWYLVVGWHDSVANTINIQVNNGSIDSSIWATGVRASTNFFAVGYMFSTAYTWPGRIGPTMFWKSAAGAGAVLSSAQRSSLWNGGNGLTYASFTA